MTTDELKKYYADLLIVQYRGKAKAHAMIESAVEPVIMDQLPIAVQNAFDLDTAVGVQLDTIGTYLDLSRHGYTFDTPITLNDTEYRTALKLKIIINSAYSSLYDIQNFISFFFPLELFVFDLQTMRLSYYLDTSIGSLDLVEFIIKQGLLPKPMGVQLGSVIYASNVHSFFGFRTYDYVPLDVSPFNTYDNYHLDYPWLSYSYALM